MMWDAAAAKTRAQGGVIHMDTKLDTLAYDAASKKWTITAKTGSGEIKTFSADNVISSAPITELVASFAVQPACVPAAKNCAIATS